MNADERVRWLEEDYAEIYGKGPSPEFELEGLSGSDTTLTIRSRTLFPNDDASTGGTEWTERDPWLTAYARPFMTNNVHHPYRIGGLKLMTHNEYRFCSGVDVRHFGALLDFQAVYGKLVRRYEKRPDGSLLVATELDLPRERIGTADLRRFNDFLDRILAETRIWFALGTSRGGQSG